MVDVAAVAALVVFLPDAVLVMAAFLGGVVVFAAGGRGVPAEAFFVAVVSVFLAALAAGLLAAALPAVGELGFAAFVVALVAVFVAVF